MSEENRQRLKEYQKTIVKFYLFFSLREIKWKKILAFYKERIIKNLFPKCKTPVSIDKVDFKKIVLSSKESYGNKDAYKYFIWYVGNVGIILLYIKLPQIYAFVKYFDISNKYINLLVYDNEILKNIHCNME